MVVAVVAVEEQVEDKEVVMVVIATRARAPDQDQGLQHPARPVPLVVVIVLFPLRPLPLQGQLLGIITGFWLSLPV